MLATIIPKFNNSNSISYDTQGYVRHDASRSKESATQEVQMDSIESSQSSKKKPSSDLHWSETQISHEELVLVPPTVPKPVKEVADPIPEDDVRRTDPRNIRQLRRLR